MCQQQIILQASLCLKMLYGGVAWVQPFNTRTVQLVPAVVLTIEGASPAPWLDSGPEP